VVFLVFSLIAKNASQKSNDLSFNATKTNVGTTPVVVYTVPAGQQAVVTTYLWQANGFGSGTEVYANLANLRMDEETVIQSVFRSVLAGSFAGIKAGETITISGNGGSNNSTVKYLITVKESPA